MQAGAAVAPQHRRDLHGHPDVLRGSALTWREAGEKAGWGERPSSQGAGSTGHLGRAQSGPQQPEGQTERVLALPLRPQLSGLTVCGALPCTVSSPRPLILRGSKASRLHFADEELGRGRVPTCGHIARGGRAGMETGFEGFRLPLWLSW